MAAVWRQNLPSWRQKVESASNGLAASRRQGGRPTLFPAGTPAGGLFSRQSNAGWGGLFPPNRFAAGIFSRQNLSGGSAFPPKLLAAICFPPTATFLGGLLSHQNLLGCFIFPPKRFWVVFSRQNPFGPGAFPRRDAQHPPPPRGGGICRQTPRAEPPAPQEGEGAGGRGGALAGRRGRLDRAQPPAAAGEGAGGQTGACGRRGAGPPLPPPRPYGPGNPETTSISPKAPEVAGFYPGLGRFGATSKYQVFAPKRRRGWWFRCIVTAWALSQHGPCGLWPPTPPTPPAKLRETGRRCLVAPHWLLVAPWGGPTPRGLLVAPCLGQSHHPRCPLVASH